MDRLASTLDTDLDWIKMHMRPCTAHWPGFGRRYGAGVQVMVPES
jgi:hypothetical protein